MTGWELVLSHTSLGVAVWFTSRWWVLRKVRVFEHDGHLALELCPPPEKGPRP